MWEETLFGEVFNENLGFKEWQKYRIDDQDLDGENKIAS